MQQVPPSMNKGSKGPAVNLLLAFLCGTGYGKDIIFDGVYGDIAEQRLKNFQKRNNLKIDGKFGAETRSCMKEDYDFDFEQACQSIPGKTTFVGGDGETIVFEN
jgi:hypothetical protein